MPLDLPDNPQLEKTSPENKLSFNQQRYLTIKCNPLLSALSNNVWKSLQLEGLWSQAWGVDHACKGVNMDYNSMAGPSPETPTSMAADQNLLEDTLRRRSASSNNPSSLLVDGSIHSAEGLSEILNNGKQQEPLTPEEKHHLYLEFHLRGGKRKGKAMMYQQQQRKENEDNWHPEDDTSTFFSKVDEILL